MSRLIDTILDWSLYSSQNSGVATPADILAEDALDVPIEDDSSTVTIPENIRDSLRSDLNASRLLVEEGGTYPDAKLRIDTGIPYRLLATAVSFARAPSRNNPTIWHQVSALNGFWGVDLKGLPASADLGTNASTMIDGNLTSVVQNFLTGTYQVFMAVQVGRVRDTTVTPHPVDALSVAFSTAASNSGLSVWGSNDANGRVWVPISISSLTLYGWRNGQHYEANTQGVSNAKTRTILFEKTERFLYFKVVFNASLATATDICNIMPLNLDGEMAMSFDGQGYTYPAPMRVDPGTSTEDRILGGATISGSATFGKIKDWPGGDNDQSQIRSSARVPGTDTIFSVVRSAGGTKYLVKATLVAGNVTYVNRKTLAQDTQRLVIVEDADGMQVITLGTTKLYKYPVSTFPADTPTSCDLVTSNHTYSLATDGTSKVWVAYLDSDFVTAGLLKIEEVSISASGAPVSAGELFTVVYEFATGTAFNIVYSDGDLYTIQDYEKPYWRKYEGPSWTPGATRQDVLYDEFGNAILVTAPDGGFAVAVDADYFYCTGFAATGSPHSVVGRTLFVRMSKSFDQLDYYIMPTTYDNVYSMTVDGVDSGVIVFTGSDDALGFIVRQNIFRETPGVSVKSVWDLTAGPVQLLRYSFTPWSFTGAEAGVEIDNIWLFNDPRGIQIRKITDYPGQPMHPKLGQPTTRVQLRGCAPGDVADPDRIRVDYTQNVKQYGTPEVLTLLARPEVRTELYTLLGGGNSAQLLDRYGRSALYVLNAGGDGLGRVGDSSFIPEVGSTVMTDEVAYGTTMTTSGEYQINYRLGVLYTYDTLPSETPSFKVPDTGAFAIEFAAISNNVRGQWHNFEGVSSGRYVGTQAFAELRTNMGLLSKTMRTSKRVWLRTTVQRQGTITKSVGTQAGGDNQQDVISPTTQMRSVVDVGRGVSRSDSSGLAAEKRSIISVQQRIGILTYLDVFGGYNFLRLGHVVVLDGAAVHAIDHCVTQLTSEHGIDVVSVTQRNLERSMRSMISQLDAVNSMDTLTVGGPLAVSHLDSCRAEQALNARSIDHSLIMLPFATSVKRERRTSLENGHQIQVEDKS